MDLTPGRSNVLFTCGAHRPWRASPALGLLALVACFARTDMFADNSHPPFSLDTSFSTGGMFELDVGDVDNLNWTPQNIAPQPDGRIVVAGTGGSIANRNYAALRLLEDGSLDSTFGNRGIKEVDLGYPFEVAQTVRLQPDGRIILAGEVSNSETAGRRVGVTRLLSDGSLDLSFGVSGWQILDLLSGEDIVNGAVVLSDGRLRLCGQGWEQPPPMFSDLLVYALSGDGSIDTGFANGGVRQIDFFGGDEFGGACEAGAANSVVVPGHVWGTTGFDAGIARVRADGTLDASFGGGSATPPGRAAVDLGGDDACEAVVRCADGTLLCVGVSAVGGVSDSAVVRFLANGELDASFGDNGSLTLDLGGDDFFRAGVELPDARIVAAGTRTNAAGDPDFSLAVLLRDGELDTSVGSNIDTPGLFSFDFGPGQADEANSLALDAQGRLLVSGNTSDGTSNNFAVLRLWL